MSSTYGHLSWGADKDNLQQYERSEWDRLNKLLRQHGFKAVQLADPQTTKNWRGMVLLDKQSIVEINKMVSTLMKDAERRQTLICDLIQSNRELRNELCQWQNKMSSKEQRTSNAEQLQYAAKLKIQEMQGDYFMKCCRLRKQVEHLQRDEQDMQIQLQQLNQNLQEKEKTIVRLKKKLYMIVTEEEQHIERQNKLFLQFHKLTTREQTTSNKITRKSVFEDIPRKRKEQLGNNRKQKYSVLDEIPEGKILIKACEDQLKGTSYRNHQTFEKNQNFQAIESITLKTSNYFPAETTPPSVLVNMIGKLCSLVNADTYSQVQRLLGTQDVDSIITKLEEHEEFFPVFYTVFKDLLQILEVDSMDHVLPAVSALKLKTR
ncbi:centrosomal protein of 70 kDa isoform X4 [Stegostoma tigrinum]|uniref:centrosomal protein of 70 kDa isoform X4 n=1 Tax=Stegostoma tigrinum TaxID=3053191 RepID=UPI00286FD471|nr:centrosomal protein of 70 kDa isoform X4 [Stegostoma tigrinum]